MFGINFTFNSSLFLAHLNLDGIFENISRHEKIFLQKLLIEIYSTVLTHGLTKNLYCMIMVRILLENFTVCDR